MRYVAALPLDEINVAAPNATKAKTYKRELAVVMLAFLGALFVWGVFDPEAKDSARFLTLPIFTFAGGAFGMDAWAKQLR